MDDIFSAISAPISSVLGGNSSGNSYGGLLTSKPIATPPAPAPLSILPQSSPLNFLSKPISSVTPLNTQTSAPAPSDTKNSFSSMIDAVSKPINSIIPLPKVQPVPTDLPAPDRNVRNMDFGDVGNLPFEFAKPFLNSLLSLKEVATGQPSGTYNAPFPHYTSVTDGDQTKRVSAEDPVAGAKTQYQNLIDKGYTPDQAFNQTALGVVGDFSAFVPAVREFGSMAALALHPEAMIDPEIVGGEAVKASKDQIHDYISGRVPATESPIPQSLRETIAKVMTDGTREEKLNLLNNGIGEQQVLQAKPSLLGKLLGITQEQTDKVLADLYGGPTREAPAGALPGYREKPFDISKANLQKGAIGGSEAGPEDLEAVGFKQKNAPPISDAEKFIREKTGTNSNNLSLGIDETSNKISLSNIEVSNKGNGLGTKTIDALKAYADNTGKQLEIRSAVNEDFFNKFKFLTPNYGKEIGDTTFTYTPPKIESGIKPSPKDQVKLENLHSQINRISQSLQAYNSNPEAHIKAYGEDRKPMYEAKIKELNQRIDVLQKPKAVIQKTPKEPVQPTDKELKLYELSLEREHVKDMLDLHPAKPLIKYISQQTGELPEVAGNKTSSGTELNKQGKFRKLGDNIVKELNTPYADLHEAQSGVNDYQKGVVRKKQIEKEYAQARQDVLNERAQSKDERSLNAILNKSAKLTDQELEERDRLEKAANEKNLLHAGYHQEVIDANHGVVPPPVRGGITAPEIDFTKAKDKATIRLGTDTMERNIEKIFPKEDAAKLNKFLVEPVRNNQLEFVKWSNALRTELKTKLGALGIKVGSLEDKLIRPFGEHQITLGDLQRALPKTWQNVQSAADLIQKTYAHIIDTEWNPRRGEFGYSPVPKRSNYFRHIDDTNEWTNQFGFIFKDSQLPTELAGVTEFFKPGKSFTTAELRRTGNKGGTSAIKAMDNYIDSVGRQAFHIDSIQRGRALEKYIREVAVASKNTPNPETGDISPLKLANFVQNVSEWTNLVAGKAAGLDRSIENTVGRPVVRFMQNITRAFGRNVIAGNISAAISHLIPTVLNAATVNKPSLAMGLADTMTAPVRKGSLIKVDGVESSFLVRRFPTTKIMNTNFNKAENTLAFLFHSADQFISRLAVASKYYEARGIGYKSLIGKGSERLSKEEAMKLADNYAQRVIGDRSVGNLPNIMNTRSLGFITQFQVEINDNLKVLMHDIPEWSEGNKSKIASSLIQFMVFSYLANLVFKKLKGSGKGLDPLNMGLTIAGLGDGSNMSLGDRLKTAGSEGLGELPFSSLATGNFPVTQALAPFKSLVTDAASGNLKATGKDTLGIASDFASPVGGGAQVLKTAEGIEAVNQGNTTTTKGKVNSNVDQTPGNYIKGALFGPTALNAADQPKVNDLFNRISSQTGNNASLIKQAEDLDSQLQKMSPADANTKAQSVAQADPQLFEKLKTVVAERKAGLTQTDRLIKQLGVANSERAQYVDGAIMKITDPDPKTQSDKRNAYLADLISKSIVTPKVLDQIKQIRANGDSMPAVANGTKTSSSSIIDRVLTYAKAIGTDPVTAFNRIFTGQTIRDVRNGAVIVDRMSFADSEAVKRQDAVNQNATVSGMRLDHTIPLEIGGSNSKDNLKLVTTAEWASYTPIEDLLGSELNAGKISKSKAQDLITRFKKGELTADQVRNEVKQ